MRTLEQLLRLEKDYDLTPEEKVLKYGVNPAKEMRYSVVDRDGRKKLVWKIFEPGEAIPDEWKASPAEFGLETEPARSDIAESSADEAIDLGPAAGLE